MHDDRSFISQQLRSGVCIPAHPLALNSRRRLDERRQRGLTRYYLDAGVGGLAVGVHTTQFAIREPQHALLRPVLELAAGIAQEFDQAHVGKPATVLIAGICGDTHQALDEAAVARELGYHAGLLSLAAVQHLSEKQILSHCACIARGIPLIGFYLQPAVGGCKLPYNFWRQFVDIEEVVAIKVAPFNRYQTLDVMRAVADSRRWQDMALLTGNDDSIVADLLSRYTFSVADGQRHVQFTSGLLGHWACWTETAVRLLKRCRTCDTSDSTQQHVGELLTLGHQVTDMNAAIFDAEHSFQGCIAGIHEVLRRQGLLEGIWCLDPREQLSPGQAAEISRVCASYPHLVDDAFVRENLHRWLD